MTDPATARGDALEHALARVGDRWSLRIVDVLLAGSRRFGELQEDLTGIASNVLAQRLRHLEREGIVVAEPYSTRPLRFSYDLTAAGRDLANALEMLVDWGAARGGLTLPLVHTACGTPVAVRLYCAACERVLGEGESGEGESGGGGGAGEGESGDEGTIGPDDFV